MSSLKNIDGDTLAALLQGKRGPSISQAPTGGGPFPRVKQNGPLRWVDKKGSCASRGCKTETYMRVRGIYRCAIHALVDLNSILTVLGVEAEICTSCGKYWVNGHVKTPEDELTWDNDRRAYIHKPCGGVISD